jgi:L-threonylcarbamoyladenylate synthase
MNILRVGDTDVSVAAFEAAKVLSSGGVVLFPTDTLYGLAVDARNIEAVAKLVALKGRDAKKAISVILPSIKSISDYAEVSSIAKKLIANHLPGALTLVLPVKDTELRQLAPDGTLGIRVPNDPFTLALGRELNAPYTATSANVSGKTSLTTIAEILAQFGEAAQMIDLVIDAGPRTNTTPSTVVRVIGQNTEVIREGAIPTADLGL